MRTEITMEFMEMEYSERKAREYSNLVARKSRKEKAKTKLALSIIGGAAMSVPVLYGMLFFITLV